MWCSTGNCNVPTLVELWFYFSFLFLTAFHEQSFYLFYYLPFLFFLFAIFFLFSGSKFILLFSLLSLHSLAFSLVIHAWYESFFLSVFVFFFNGLPMCISIKLLLYNKSWGPAAQGNRYRTWLGRQLDYNQISVSGETKLQCNFKRLGGQNPQNGLLFTTYCS